MLPALRVLVEAVYSGGGRWPIYKKLGCHPGPNFWWPLFEEKESFPFYRDLMQSPPGMGFLLERWLRLYRSLLEYLWSMIAGQPFRLRRVPLLANHLWLKNIRHWGSRLRCMGINMSII